MMEKNVGKRMYINMDGKNKCFVMMPFSEPEGYVDGHFNKIYEQIISPAIESAGFISYRVDENRICDKIIEKIFEAIQDCEMALCDLSGRNPNVLYELGLRQAYDKPVVLIQDERTERIFDVSGISTIEYKSDRIYEHVLEARERIKESIIATKEGKSNSIVKIVKARNAIISPESVSKEDRIEILLQGVMSEINEIKDESYFYKKIKNDFSLPTDKNELELYCNMVLDDYESQISRWEKGDAKISDRHLDSMMSNLIGLKDKVLYLNSWNAKNQMYHRISNLKNRVSSLMKLKESE